MEVRMALFQTGLHLRTPNNKIGEHLMSLLQNEFLI